MLEKIFASTASRAKILKDKNNGHVVKVMKNTNVANNEYVIHRELSMLKTDMVATLFGRIQLLNNIGLVMEEGKHDLFLLIEYNAVTPTLAQSVFKRICEIVRMMHQNNICHLDLKLENFILSKDNIIKIIDFGHSLKLPPNSKVETSCGSEYYCSPEIVQKKIFDPYKSDIWSLGIIFHLLLVNSWPYKGTTEEETKINYNASNIDIYYQAIRNSLARDLISKILISDPFKRISIDAILAHDYFSCNVNRMSDIIQPIILCGGNGLRLWPLSTVTQPKQFISIHDNQTLLDETILRLELIKQTSINTFLEPLLIMNKNHTYNSSNIVYEEYCNDTAVAILHALLAVRDQHSWSRQNEQGSFGKKQTSENVIVLIVPSDHYIENQDRFSLDIISGLKHITDDNIVLFGITATSPQTKYGYITSHNDKVQFQEKPDSERAQELIKQKALWNSGIVASRVDTLLKAIESASYNIMDWIVNPREGKAPSFDVAVLQQYSNLYVHRCTDWGWSDVGTWDSFTDISYIRDEMTRNEMNENNSVINQHCENVKILNRGAQKIVVIGCDNLLVVCNDENILIVSTNKNYSDDLKNIVEKIN